jgi:hypothetical protein
VVIAVPSFKVGSVKTVDQKTRFDELFSPDFSMVPYSYINSDCPPRLSFQPSGEISDRPSYPATYQKSFQLDEAVSNGQRLYLDLGDVRELARVRLNGKQLGILWLKPFRIDITNTVRVGINQLEIDVVNLWPNRLIGDEQFADDRGKSWKVWPDWMDDFLASGKRPSTQRQTFTTWKHYKKTDPLLSDYPQVAPAL